MQTSPNVQPESTSKEQKLNRGLLIGSIVFFCGILAFIVPQALVPAGSGDTEGAWLAGFSCSLPWHTATHSWIDIACRSRNKVWQKG